MRSFVALPKDERLAFVISVVALLAVAFIVWSGMRDVLSRNVFGVAFTATLLGATSAFFAFWFGHGRGINNPETKALGAKKTIALIGVFALLVVAAVNIVCWGNQPTVEAAQPFATIVSQFLGASIFAGFFGCWRARGIAALNAREEADVLPRVRGVRSAEVLRDDDDLVEPDMTSAGKGDICSGRGGQYGS